MRAEPQQDLGSGGRTGRPRTDPEVRFWTRVTKTPTCWLWQGAKGRGYGRFKTAGRHGQIVQAHRFAYEALVGPIPSGFQIDHLCRVRHCVNPAHMEIVTQQEPRATRADLEARAEKAERALAEAERMFAAAVYATPNSEITVWPIHVEVDLTLERYDDPVNKCSRYRTTLRSSEDTSDES